MDPLGVVEGVYWGLLGAVTGSAANAVIDRLPAGVSWFSGRSKCDSCGRRLEVKDLVPLFSYLALRGKCRYCGKKIPARNFWVELAMTAGFLVIFATVSPTLEMAAVMGIFWTSVVLAVMDMETKLVAEGLVGLLAVLVWVETIISSGGGVTLGSVGQWMGLLTGVVVIGGLWAASRGRAMGFGDVEIAVVVGWWVGWPIMAVALWVAFVAGGVWGLGLLWWKKAGIKSEVAFGQFLLLGMWVAWIYGERIWSWFMGNF